MNSLSPARETAFSLLQKWEKEQAFADILYREAMDHSTMNERDKSLCGFLFYGTVENLLLVDYLIAGVSSVKIKKMHPFVRSALRISVFQILRGEKLPLFAIIDQAVEAVSRVNPRAKGMVNAILRRLSVYREQEVDLSDLPVEEKLSIRYSHPVDLVKLYISLLGPNECESVLKRNLTAPSTEIRVNTLKTTPSALKDSLSKEGFLYTPDSSLPEIGTVTGDGSAADTDAFHQGLFTVQSKSSYLSVLLADPQPGETLIDVCAAPGGKSFAAACLMKDSGCIYSRDLYDGRINEIASGAERLEIDSIRIRKWDATIPDPGLIGAADVVLVDVPCSGLGIIAKKPDIKYKSMDSIRSLQELQLRILKASSRLLKLGGRLIYSTCTVNPAENQEVVDAFLSSEPGFFRENAQLPDPFGTCRGERTLWPHIDQTDGFYFCRIKRMN